MYQLRFKWWYFSGKPFKVNRKMNQLRTAVLISIRPILVREDMTKRGNEKDHWNQLDRTDNLRTRFAISKEAILRVIQSEAKILRHVIEYF